MNTMTTMHRKPFKIHKNNKGSCVLKRHVRNTAKEKNTYLHNSEIKVTEYVHGQKESFELYTWLQWNSERDALLSDIGGN